MLNCSVFIFLPPEYYYAFKGDTVLESNSWIQTDE